MRLMAVIEHRYSREWTRLNAAGALKTSADGVVYPHRENYLNEYLMMIRDAFIADAKKAPKRITGFGMILASDAHEGPPAVEAKRLAALPKTSAKIKSFESAARQEPFRFVISQFVEAYNLLQDTELATLFDEQSLALVAKPPSLPAELAAVVDDQQKSIAGDVGVAHALSELMSEHWKSRNEFFTKNRSFFVPLVRELSQLANPALEKIGAQFAVAGSYTARLHADHLRVPPPSWRWTCPEAAGRLGQPAPTAAGRPRTAARSPATRPPEACSPTAARSVRPSAIPRQRPATRLARPSRATARRALSPTRNRSSAS